MHNLAYPIRFLLFTITICLTVLASVSLPAYSATPDKYTGVVTEYEAGAYLVQVNDYSIVVPEDFYLDSGGQQVESTDAASLRIGSVVTSEIAGTNDNGFWKARSFTIYEGTGLSKLLEELDEDTQLRINGTLKHIAENQNSEPDTEQLTSTEESNTEDSGESNVLIFENGVWKN